MTEKNTELNRFSGKRISLLGELNARGGYGLHNFAYVKCWLDLGIHVTVRPTVIRETEDAKIPMFVKRCYVHKDQPEEWEIVISPAHFVPLKRRKLAYFTLFESSLWTPRQIKLLSKSDAVITASDWNIHGLRSSGFTGKVFKVPLGYSEESFRYQPMDMVGPCTFGIAGNLAHGPRRKNLDMIVECFLQEFVNETDVRLWIKTFPENPTRFVYDRRVIVRQGMLKESQLAEWFAGITCFVSAARGEGWGLMQLESCSVGRPVISPLHGGVREFLTHENCYPLEFHEGPSEEAWTISGGQWAIPDENHLRHLMRRVYNDRLEAQRIGKIAAETTRHLTWKNSAIRCLQVLEELGAI